MAVVVAAAAVCKRCSGARCSVVLIPATGGVAQAASGAAVDSVAEVSAAAVEVSVAALAEVVILEEEEPAEVGNVALPIAKFPIANSY